MYRCVKGDSASEIAMASSMAALDAAQKLVTLPSVKGSRQIIQTELAAAEMCNLGSYADYAHDHRVETDPNKLVNVVWNGVRDRYGKAGMYARGLRFVILHAPARFVVKSLVDRPNVHKVMGIIRATSVQLYDIRQKCFADRDWRPPLDIMKTNMLEEYPQWREKWEKWEKAQSRYFQRVYDIGTDAELWFDTAELLMEAIAPMLKTLDRNRDPDDIENIHWLKHAPVDTDEVESGFGCFDEAMYKTIAGVYAVEGIALSMKLHAFDSPVEKQKEKRKRLGLKHDAEVDASDWKMTDWYNYPAPFRWKLIREVMRKMKAAKKEHKTQQDAQATETMSRHKRDKEAALKTMMNAALRYHEHKATPLALTVQDLDDLLKKAGKSNTAQDKVIKQQLQLRKYCYAAKVPKISEKDRTRLHDSARALIEEEQTAPLPRAMPQPPAMQLRPSHHAPDKHAIELDKQHLQEAMEQQKALMMLVSQGNFSAHTHTNPATRKARKPRKEAAVQARVESESERELDIVLVVVLDIVYTSSRKSIPNPQHNTH